MSADKIMGKIDTIPLGMTEVTRAQSGEAMHAPCPNTGWRKASLAVRASDTYADAGERMDVPKQRAMLAVKRVGVHIGLKASDVMLLDTLAAFSQPQDWTHGQRAIVWPSNALLMEHTGFSLSALKRHVNRLAAAGMTEQTANHLDTGAVPPPSFWHRVWDSDVFYSFRSSKVAMAAALWLRGHCPPILW